MPRKKRTPKNSNKKGKRNKEKQEKLIILIIFVVFVAIVAYLFYSVNMVPDESAVAVVNGEEITMQNLDWWYELSILPDQRNSVTKREFLETSLIPQQILLQEAKKNNIKIKTDEVEKLVGLYIIENGLTMEGFEEQLTSRGHTIDDVKKSFETRGMIIKLLEEENIPDDDFNKYINNLIGESEIEIFEENIGKITVRSFKETGDELCGKEKIIIRLYTTSWCDICNDSVKTFNGLIEEFAEDAGVAFHWSLDTGDDLLTLEREHGIPEDEAEVFEKYSPNRQVPATVVGCKYTRIGSLSDEEAEEFRAIIKTLADG